MNVTKGEIYFFDALKPIKMFMITSLSGLI